MRLERRTVLAARLCLLVVGAFVIAASVAVMLWNDLGPGPLDVFISALRRHTGVPLAVAVWSTVGTLTLVAWGLGRRPGLGTIVGPIVVGPSMQLVLAHLEQLQPPQHAVARVAVHLLAIGAIGIGAGAVYNAGLGAGTGELLAAAASDRSGRPEAGTRMVLEVTWLAAGVAMGGPIGLGTLLVALCIGPSVANGRALVGSGVAISRRQLAALRA